MSRETVLSLLLAHRQEPLSGETMSRQLGVSRAAVWKAIEALRQEGYVISSAPNRGYRLESAPDRVREGELVGPLAGCRVGSTLACLDVTDSTNTECKRRAMAGAPEGLAVLAEEQTGGRGRRGRSFHSPRGRGLYLSVLLRPELPLEAVNDFTAWVAVAVCDGIEAACGLRPRIKWTNDLVIGKKKLGGILTELSLDGGGNVEYAVIGIGINCNQNIDDFPEEIKQIATSLQLATGKTINRAAVIAQILVALQNMSESLQDPAATLDLYRADCITLGQEISLVRGDEIRHGTAMDVDENGALLVAFSNGCLETVNSGEVSVRGMYGYV